MKLHTPAAAAFLSLAVLAPQAHAGLLDFNYTTTQVASANPEGSGPFAPLGIGGYVSQAYGDVADLVNMSYRYFDTRNVNTSSLATWTSGYDELVYVAWTGAQGGGDRAEVELASVNGSVVTLNSFSLGSWSGDAAGKTETVVVREIGGGVVFSQTLNVGVNNLSNSFAINASSTTGFIIGWTSPWWTAIDNINSSAAAAPIPEPGTWALMGLGLAAVGVASRQRKAC